MNEVLMGSVDELMTSYFSSTAEESKDGDSANMVDGLFELSRSITTAARLLGLNGAATPFGALENLARENHEGMDRIASSIGEGFSELSSSIRELAEAISSSSNRNTAKPRKTTHE